MDILKENEVFEILSEEYEFEVMTLGNKLTTMLINQESDKIILPKGGQNFDLSHTIEIVKTALEIGTFALTIYKGLKKEKSSINITLDEVIEQLNSKSDKLKVSSNKSFIIKLLELAKKK